MRCEQFREAMMPGSEILQGAELTGQLTRHLEDCHSCQLWLEDMNGTKPKSVTDLTRRLEEMRIWP